MLVDWVHRLGLLLNSSDFLVFLNNNLLLSPHPHTILSLPLHLQLILINSTLTALTLIRSKHPNLSPILLLQLRHLLVPHSVCHLRQSQIDHSRGEQAAVPLAFFGHVDERWVRVRGKGPVVWGRGKGLGTRSQAVHFFWYRIGGSFCRKSYGLEKECVGLGMLNRLDWYGARTCFYSGGTAGWMEMMLGWRE